MVLASHPVASLILFAALPVGACQENPELKPLKDPEDRRDDRRLSCPGATGDNQTFERAPERSPPSLLGRSIFNFS